MNSEQNHNEIANHLLEVLIDSYVLYLKTQNYHWNVTGPSFRSLHLLFEEQYNDLFAAIDLIAERARTLGIKVPASVSKYIEKSRIQEGDENANAQEMIEGLSKDQELIIKTIKNALKVAQENQDDATVDMLTHRLEVHQKNGWMLRSSLA